MKYFSLFLLVTCLTCFSAKAQFGSNNNIPENPVRWDFDIKKIDDNHYRIEAKATMSDGFHIWAQDPGGDGSLIPTSFTAEGLANGSWITDWEENKKPKTQQLSFVDGAVNWHEKEITFYRDFKGKKGDKVKGAVQYQSCNDEMCFPPAIENFILLVK